MVAPAVMVARHSSVSQDGPCQCQQFRRRGAAARRRTRCLGAGRRCSMQRWPRALPPRRRAASPSRALTRLGQMFCCRDPGVAPRRRKALLASQIARTAASLQPTHQRRVARQRRSSCRGAGVSPMMWPFVTRGGSCSTTPVGATRRHGLLASGRERSSLTCRLEIAAFSHRPLSAMTVAVTQWR